MPHLTALIALAITLHGAPQEVRLFGNRAGKPVIVASGDGGWLHLAPHVADWLAAHGYFVIGFDAKTYLSSSTNAHQTLKPADIARDYLALIDATTSAREAPVLLGISEGAGLTAAM
jgi:type IV secretory pathway VirJ component